MSIEHQANLPSDGDRPTIVHASEYLLQAVIEAVHDYAILTLDPHGRVTSWNMGAHRLLGYDAAEIIGQPISRFYLPEDVARPDREMQTALLTGRSEDESWRVRQDGSRFWCNEIITPLVADDGTHLGFAKISRDRTARKAAEAALRASEERLRVTMENIRDYAIITQDHNGTITGWNVGAEQIFGYTTAEAVGQSFAIIFVPEDRAQGAHLAEMRQAHQTGRAEDERWHLRKDGSRFFASGVLVSAQAQGSISYVKVARDLTARKRMEDQLEAEVRERTAQVRSLVTELTLSEQEERHRISTILHDDLQQRLYGMNFQLAALDAALAQDEVTGARQLIPEITAALQDAVYVARELSVDLSPPVLHNEGVVEALRWLAAQMQKQYGLGVDVQVQGSVPLVQDDLRVLLFQTVRELLFNAVKHAQVNSAVVVVTYAEEQVQLAVSDHGQGFDPTQTAPTSQGLLRIRQRLQLLGGQMAITSAPGQGTHVVLRVPLPAQATT
jgi:PAS domain S-box-containing protein